MSLSKNEIVSQLQAIQNCLNAIEIPTKKRRSVQDFTNDSSLVAAKLGVSSLITNLKKGGDKS